MREEEERDEGREDDEHRPPAERLGHGRKEEGPDAEHELVLLRGTLVRRRVELGASEDEGNDVDARQSC